MQNPILLERLRRGTRRKRHEPLQVGLEHGVERQDCDVDGFSCFMRDERVYHSTASRMGCARRSGACSPMLA